MGDLTDPTSAAPAACGSTPVVLFDLASLRFRFGPNKRSISVLSGAGEHLALVPATATEDTSTVAFRALTCAMETSRVLRVGPDGEVVGHTIALYNPFTAQISYVDDDGAAVFVTTDPVPIDAAGVVLALTGPAGARTMSGDGVEAYERRMDSFAVTRALAAYA